MKKVQLDRLIRRKRRVSANIVGTNKRPRLSVRRSNRYIYIQAIDDEARKTLASFSSYQMKKKAGAQKSKKSQDAFEAGKLFAAVLQKKHITQGVFDRSLYAYLGRVKALAEGLREGGIKI